MAWFGGKAAIDARFAADVASQQAAALALAASGTTIAIGREGGQLKHWGIVEGLKDDIGNLGNENVDVLPNGDIIDLATGDIIGNAFDEPVTKKRRPGRGRDKCRRKE